jgi:hypothetical protein
MFNGYIKLRTSAVKGWSIPYMIALHEFSSKYIIDTVILM